MLRVYKEDIIDSKGKKVILRGFNLGGWLMMEGYILGGRNIPEKEFKKNLTKAIGRTHLKEFEILYRDNFITEEDIKLISKRGFNCVRIPFNFRLIEVRPYIYKEDGLRYLDNLVDWCKRYKIYSILDLHAAQGSQNPDWHSDSSGKAFLWEKEEFRKRVIKLWKFLAERYKGEDFICGYDLLNEPVCKENKKILKIYKEIVKAIREVDREHLIFLEGENYAQDLDFLGPPFDENLVYSIHFYQPLDFTFNLQRNLVYPGRIYGLYWSKSKLREILSKYYRLKKKFKVPIYVGEFGINSRCSYCHGELRWLKDTLEVFREFGFHWTYWTYKSTASGIWPDGIFQYLDNPEWIKREEVVFGWERFYSLWKKRKTDIAKSWQTENFKENRPLLKLLSSV
jgi:aryl-phospho-beta-D-glucosidase BglC (GH1 family)